MNDPVGGISSPAIAIGVQVNEPLAVGIVKRKKLKKL